MEATIQLKGCRSHSVTIKGNSVKFIFGRGFPTSNTDVIEYCESQPDMFGVTKKVEQEKSDKLAAAPKQQAVEHEEREEDDSPTKSESPPPRGRRRKVKAE